MGAITEERRSQLARILVTEGSVKVGVACRTLCVSTETIRKDLIFLEKEGLAKKSHGGAVSSGALFERPLSARSTEHVAEKAKIARAAVELIPVGGVVILDAGSTTYQVAKLLTLHKGLTILTNSASIAHVLSGSPNTVFSLGGEMRGTSMAFVGPWTLHALESVRADVAFIGTDGFCGRTGPTCAAYAEAEVKRAMVRASRAAAVVCDSSKFSADGMFQICGWDEIRFIITDSTPPAPVWEALGERTELVIAE